MNSMPSVKDLELAFKDFELIDWENVTLENIAEIIPYPLKALNIEFLPYTSNKYFYRARTFDSFQKNNKEDIENDNYFLPKSFSYTPKDITTLGRANLNKFPVFYAASNILVAEMEMKKNETLKFISCWKSTKELNIIPYINNIVSLNKDAKEIKENLEKGSRDQFGHNISEVRNLLNEFNQKEFSKEITHANEYKYSAWNSYRYLYELRESVKIDAIAYPTIINPSKGTNFAIHPEFIDNYMELECVYLINYQVYNQNNKIAGFRNILKIGIPNENVIFWRNLTKDEKEYFIKNHHVPEIAIH